MPEPIRCPIGIATMQDTDTAQGETYVVCADGSCWYMYHGGWAEYPPIPGSQADQERKDPHAEH